MIRKYPRISHLYIISFVLVSVSVACSFSGFRNPENDYDFPEGNLPDEVDYYRSPNESITRDAYYGSSGYIFKKDYIDIHPAWSPDGSQIAFNSDRDGEFDIYVMNSDGSNVINLTPDPSPLLLSLLYMIDKGNDAWPNWSPDGTQITFSSARDNIMMMTNTLNVFVMDSDGSNVKNLTFTNEKEGVPFWSPDGNQLVFGQVKDENVNLFRMDGDATNVAQLTDLKSINNYPAWSPDGSQIAFESDRDGDLDIYLMKVDGSEITQLTDHPSPDRRPTWAPDGQRIAFMSYRDGDAEIFIMNKDGSNIIQLTKNETTDGDPAWSPLGDSIAFATKTDLGSWIYKISIDGSNLTQLTGTPVTDLPRENAIFYLQQGVSQYYQYLSESEGSLDSVILSLSKAIDLDPSLAEAYLGRGLAYFQRCDFDWAHVIRTEIKILKKNKDCLDYAQAVTDLEKAIGLGLAPGVMPGAINFLEQIK